MILISKSLNIFKRKKNNTVRCLIQAPLSSIPVGAMERAAPRPRRRYCRPRPPEEAQGGFSGAGHGWKELQ